MNSCSGYFLRKNTFLLANSENIKTVISVNVQVCVHEPCTNLKCMSIMQDNPCNPYNTKYSDENTIKEVPLSLLPDTRPPGHLNGAECQSQRPA